MLSAGQDVGLVSISFGASKDAVLVNIESGILHGHHDVCPRGGVEVARAEVFGR